MPIAFLFLLVSVIFIVFLVFSLGSALLTWLNAQRWTKVPARILRADLRLPQRERYSRCDYKVLAEYTYLYQGQKHKGRDIGLFKSTRFFDSSVRQRTLDIYCELSEYQNSDKSFPCYVNPAQPDQALLYRNLPWLSVFAHLSCILLCSVLLYTLLYILGLCK